jgi:perosamine synthetase
MPTPVIPLARPWIGDHERDLVRQVLESDVLALGPFAEEMEREVAALAGRRHGVACSNGTAGLHMVTVALGIGEGDEVLTTPFSFVASTNCLLYERATPRFVDIEEETLGMDPELVAQAATPRTKAILPVHVFGHPCRIDDLTGLARERGWRVIEDSCEGLGCRHEGRPLGSFGDAGVFAFYPNKQITTGEGGVVVTDDDEIASVLRSLRNQGRDTDGTWLRHVRLGYNYRMDELSAALGVAQLARLSELQAGRARVVQRYAQALAGLDWLTLPTARAGASVDWFVYVVRLAPGVERDALMEGLARLGIPSRPYFSPLHLQPFLSDLGYKAGDFPVTERVARSTLALPFSPLLGDDEIGRVADGLREVMRSIRAAA